MKTNIALSNPCLGPPVLSGTRLRTVGFDMWSTAYPKCSLDLADLLHMVEDSHFQLEAIHPSSNSGDREHDGAMRLRFKVRDEETHATDEAIIEALLNLSPHLFWLRVSKLAEVDGIPAYVPLPIMERK